MNFFRHGGFGVTALALTSLISGAHASTIDQSQTSQVKPIASFGATGLAQSFQQTHNNITGASVFLYNTNGGQPGDVVTISLYDKLPNAGGNLLASGTATGVAPGNEATVSFAPTTVTPGQTYFLVFSGTNVNEELAGDINNPYPSGEAYANPGYQAFPSYDYAFQTYYGAPVPEASTTVSLGFLLTLGLGGVLIARKRKAGAAA